MKYSSNSSMQQRVRIKPSEFKNMLQDLGMPLHDVPSNAKLRIWVVQERDTIREEDAKEAPYIEVIYNWEAKGPRGEV